MPGYEEHRKAAYGKTICIIGMHRSGTSMVARLLNLCGLDFGPHHQLLPPNFANPMGYYENNSITYKINEPLLNRLGGSWDKPPVLSDGWETDPSLDDIYREARSLIHTLSKSTFWGWKDPRTTLLLPFWKSLVPDLRFVICVRNPLDVAMSLASRDNLSIKMGIDLWTLYMKMAIRDTQGCPRTFIFYEDYFNNADEEFDMLLEFSGLRKPRGLSIADNFIFRNLRHHTSDLEGLAKSKDVPTETLLLYMKLRFLMSENSPDMMLSSDLKDIVLKRVDQFTPAHNNVIGRHEKDALKLVLDRVADSKRKANHKRSIHKKRIVDANNKNNTTLKPQKNFLPNYTMEFPVYEEPLVSIIIPSFNRVEYLCSCLRTVLYHTTVPYELIVVDDASSDATHLLLDRLENVQIVRNEVNMDFLSSTNKGASIAKGRHIMFLNNDVTVRKDWLTGLVNTMERYPDCGAVGAKVIGMDGSLQEAGTIIWHDGNTFQYGLGDDPFRPEYSFIREVDYCSAACLLVRAKLFRKLGGFDERYVPAYFEDPDLCLGIQQLGYKVVFQPDVTIFHRTTGSRPLDQAQALYQANQPKFALKWASNLAQRDSSDNLLLARDLRRGKRVLVLAEKIIIQSELSESTSIRKLLRMLVDLKLVVTFFPLDDPHDYQSTTHDLQQLGVEVFYDASLKLEKFLQNRSGYYDIIIFNSPLKESNLLDLVYRCFPSAEIMEETEVSLRLPKVAGGMGRQS